MKIKILCLLVIAMCYSCTTDETVFDDSAQEQESKLRVEQERQQHVLIGLELAVPIKINFKCTLTKRERFEVSNYYFNKYVGLGLRLIGDPIADCSGTYQNWESWGYYNNADEEGVEGLSFEIETDTRIHFHADIGPNGGDSGPGDWEF